MAVTVYAQRRVIGTNRYDYDLKGLSTDPKPSQIYGIDIVENSLFLEMDTGDFYYLKSLGGSSTTRETLIEEQSFTAEEQEEQIGQYFSTLNGETFSEETIKVLFDGVVYDCTLVINETPAGTSYEYGAPFIDETGYFDFSEIPFCLGWASEDATVGVFVPDGNEHTIEVYTESTVTTPTVWEKVGGGSSSANNLVGSAVVGTAKAG